ncbi:MAG TPA: hypothetical protein VGY53_00015 [Isosphaeraceae bacterium]|nr:hypothetical protein [Isosphaeraceae bacterium]
MSAPRSDLPIIQLDPQPRSRRDRYGALLYLGAGGLVVLVCLLGWFGWNLWTLRGFFSNLYQLHNSAVAEPIRIQAAYAIAHDSRVPQQQYWNDCLDKSLPRLARYILAESLTADAMASDPKTYADKVAYSEGWPDWLRYLLVRPLAYGAEVGITFPEKPLRALTQHADPAVRLWSNYVLAASVGDTDAIRALANEASGKGPFQRLASDLQSALKAKDAERTYWLDLATRWLRIHHPQAMTLWKGWEEQGGHLVQKAEAGP